MKVLIAKIGTILALSSLLLAGCGGGGGGGGGSVSPPPPPPPPPSGGITRTGVAFAAGPITGFGSVWVNGVEYNTDTAQFIRDDDDSALESEFKEGETVIVKGTIEDDNSNAVAETVELDEIVKGPATEVVNPTTATVMGQTVNSDAGTWVDDSCAPATFKDLTGLDTFFAVEVYGVVQDGGAITATRIECKQVGEVTEFEVNGIVSENDPGSTFMINGLQVDYSATPLLQNFPNGEPENDQPVEVKGPAPASFVDGTPPVLAASKVEYKGNRLDGNEGDHYEIEGFITDFQAAADFSTAEFNLRVGNLLVAVATDDNTDYEPVGASARDLNNGLKIEVEGEDNGSDQILATKIEIKSSTNIRVTGLVDAGSVGTDTFSVMDIVVNTIDGTTQFEDKSDSPSLDPTAIEEGWYLEVRGQEKPAGQITAFRVERDDFDSTRTDQFELRGFVTSKTMPTATPTFGSLTILGVTVDTDSNTEYRDVDDLPMLEADFWAAVTAGESLVDAKGNQPDPSVARILAEEMELESL